MPYPIPRFAALDCPTLVSYFHGYGPLVARLGDDVYQPSYISFEPLLERIVPYFGKPGIKWVIIGGQTKPIVYPNIEWVQEIVEAADKAGIPVFLKNSLRTTIHWAQCYAEPVVDVRGLLNEVAQPRQEMPKALTVE